MKPRDVQLYTVAFPSKDKNLSFFLKSGHKKCPSWRGITNQGGLFGLTTLHEKLNLLVVYSHEISC